jgi:hypothetical protein
MTLPEDTTMNDATAPDRKPFVFEIREEKFAELADRLDRMIRRARKNNLPAPSFEVIWEADEKRRVPDGFDEGNFPKTREAWVRYLYVTVDGRKPTLQGWDFVATIDHTEQGADGVGNVIKAVPGVGDIPVSYRNALPVCEHCNAARRRNETFVVRRADDPAVTKQIGRNCLVDFFPGDDPAEVAQQLAWWVEARELLAEGEGGDEFFGGRRGEERYGLESVLGVAQACIEAFGWTSRTKARDTGEKATADYVTLPYAQESRLSTQDKQDLAKIREHYDAEKSAPMVAAALEWVRSIDPETAEDYLYNLHVVCRGESVRADRLGLACSLLPAHRRHLGLVEAKKAAESREPSEYVGTVGQRGLFRGCVLKYVSEPYASDWGTTTRLCFEQGPNVIVWWASNPEGFEQGATYDLVATPKKHDPYRNPRTGVETKQTVVSRVAVATEKDINKFTKAPRRRGAREAV